LWLYKKDVGLYWFDVGPTIKHTVGATSGQTSCRPMHSIWTLDIGRETIGKKTLYRRTNVEPISRANVDPMSKMMTDQRWHSTSNQRQGRPLTDIGPTSPCRQGISWREQVTWDYDADICFILDQHAKLTQWSNYTQVDMSLHSDTLSWFWVKQSLL
jgi:hypothetical protein